jgi:parvulin-like peptidyl-prolyl isomerase
MANPSEPTRGKSTRSAKKKNRLQVQSVHPPKPVKKTPSRAAKKAAQAGSTPRSEKINTKRRNIITIASIALVVIIVAALAYYLIAITPMQRVLLTVNNEDIATGYFLKRVVANPSGDVTSTLQGLVGEYIIKQDAAANGVAPVTDQDIDKYLRDEANSTLSSNTTGDSTTTTTNTTTTTTTTTTATMTDAEFNKWFKDLLNNSGLSAKEYREVVAREIQRQRLADILSADIPDTMTQLNYGAILYSTQSAATAAKAKIDAGADFGAMVTAATAAGQSAFDQAWEPYAAIDPQLATAAQALEVGKCSDPITYQQSSSTASSGTVTGYVLLMVHEVKDNVPVTDAQKNILKSNGLSNWLTEQIKTATVVIHDLNGVTLDGLTQSMDSATLTYLNYQVQKLVSKRPSVTSTETTTTPTTTTSMSP